METLRRDVRHAQLVRVWEEHPGGHALAGNRWLSWRTRRAWSALLAMGLAGVGLYAALSYGVSQRRRELGVRAALGASRRQLVRLVLREGLAVTLAGVVLGVAAASGLTRLMDRLLFATSPLDALASTLGPALLIAVGVAASLLPALRAASADPSTVLRGD